MRGEGPPKVKIRHFEFDLARASGGDGEVDAAHAGADLGAELEELEANGLDGSVGELGMAQCGAPQGVDEHIILLRHEFG